MQLKNLLFKRINKMWKPRTPNNICKQKKMKKIKIMELFTKNEFKQAMFFSFNKIMAVKKQL